ncbi:hypothetical protein HYPDE_24273 [Hyphomicrobium denitrificans 1NES1]|uniref:Uncharacterized protein n=1 Tax=Hyphomicrobium denitrificans 1NES1 TaxID=670307 RepID=N0B923_9HYPH|nr:hypothetical protein HYPDE_24273 [Hyphomicrobium denitrificans 1NES1]
MQAALHRHGSTLSEGNPVGEHGVNIQCRSAAAATAVRSAKARIGFSFLPKAAKPSVPAVDKLDFAQCRLSPG